MAYIGQTSCNLRQSYQELIRYTYIRHNNPQSAYVQQILNNRHEYGPIKNTISLLKHINKTSVLLPYEQLNIQTHQKHKQLTSEQSTGEHIPYTSWSMTHSTRHFLRDQPINTHQQQNKTRSILIVFESCLKSWYANKELRYIGRTYRIFWNILLF